MAQIVKLRRTSTAGKVPTTSNLELGELAMNTNDGRIFFEKNDGSATIQEILTTNPNNPTTGSINLNGSFTASAGIQVAANIMPNADNTLSLGSSTLRFQLNGGTPVTVDGNGTANTITRFQSATTVEDSNIVSSDTATTFTHSNNGNTIFTVSGSNGELLTITDSNTGNLLEVNDASGIDVFTVSAVGDVSASGAITASGITGLTSLSVNGNIHGTSFNGTGLVSGSAGLSYATSTVRGVVELFSDTTQTVAANSVSSTASRTYGIQLNSANQAVVNVPWSNTTFSVSDLNGTGVISGSVLRPNGDNVFSGSLEDLTKGTNVVSGSGQISIVTNGVGIFSGSDQIDGFVSKSANFTSNQLIVADGTNSVISSGILSLDTANNYLGINQSSPSVTLHMTGEAAQSAQIRMEQHNDSGDAPDIRTRKSRGTAASPSKNNAGDFIYRSNHERYNGSSYVTVGQLAVDANGSNADRFQLTLAVSENGSAIDAADAQFKIDGNDGGAITFNNAYTFPTSDGSSGQALITDASGQLSFGAPNADLNGTGVISGSVLRPNGDGVFSGSAQVYNTFSGSGLISSSAEGSSQGQINLNGSAVNVNALGTNDSPSFTNLTVTGDLTVQGTTTTENSQQVNIGDNILNLNYGGSSTTGGIYVSDGTGGSTTSGSLLWDATNDYWKAGKLGSEQKLIRENGDGIVTQSAQIDAQSATNPAAIYDNSGTPTLRSGITQGELQTAIGVDAAGTKNSTDVTLAGSYDYITAGGTDNQTLTLGQIDLTTDVTGILPSANLDADTAHLSGTQTFTGAKTFNASGNSIIVGDTLRIAEDGSGMRMTNVGAFESSSAGFHIFSNDDLRISTNGSGAGTTALTLDKTTKDATFEGNILAGNISGSSFNGTGLVSQSAQIADVTITTAAQPNITSLGTLTTLTVDDITINGSTISDSGDLTLDIGGDLNIDVDGADIILKDGGTAFGRFKRDTSDFVIKSETQDKDIIFKGNDNGSTITALTLDMSNAGRASFNSGIDAGGSITATTSLDLDDGTYNTTLTPLQLNFYNNDTSIEDGDSLGHISFRGKDDITALPQWKDGGQIKVTANGDWGSAIYPGKMALSVRAGGSDGDLTDIIEITSDNVNINTTTQSTSKTTGGVIIDGGVGIAKTLNVGEDVVAYASSDERYKDNVTPIENPNEKLKQIGGYTFDWNDKHEVFKGQHDVGVIAQEIEKVLPEIVETRESGYKAVKYEKIVALLIESNKELLKRIEDLESKIK